MNESFIMSLSNAIDANLCNDLINFFEINMHLQNQGVIGDGIYPDIKKSTDITISNNTAISEVDAITLQTFTNVLFDKISNYMEQYSFTTNLGDVGIRSLDSMNFDSYYNIQRYLPGEGFYHWHCENCYTGTANRQLAWMVYLNTVADQGGTEFKFQNHIEKAEQGKLVIWPAFWTHLHRGIPSPTETKYIATGWVSYSGQ